MVRTMKEMLYPLIRGDLGSWAKRLPEVQYAINTSVHRRHGSTPFSLLYARPHSPLRMEPALAQRPLNVRELQRRYELMHQVVFPAIAGRTTEYNKRVLKDFFKKHELITTDYPSGALVMKQVLPRTSKSEPAWEGPYFVIKRNRGGAYVLRDSANSVLPRPTPVSQLRLVSHESAINPDSFEVDHIVMHRNRRNGPREYLIRWKGYDPKYDSWVDEADINTLKCITDYWKNKTTSTRSRSRPRVGSGVRDDATSRGEGGDVVTNRSHGSITWS